LVTWLWQINAAEHGGRFQHAHHWQVQLGSKPITQPGPDRMVVFQNYAPPSWRTAFENIYIAVNAVHPNKSKAEKTAIVRSIWH